MDYWLAIALFALSSGITPGPNNVLVMASAVNFGIRASLPLVLGICLGFTLMLFLIGLGFGHLFERFPALHLIIKCAGVLYLLYLAWLIAHSAKVKSSDAPAKPLSFIKGALFQWVNGKAWIVATGAVAAFTTVGEGFYGELMVLVLIFFLATFPCAGTWLFFGSALKRFLKSDRQRRWFNYSMAVTLLLSVAPVIREIILYQYG